MCVTFADLIVTCLDNNSYLQSGTTCCSGGNSQPSMLELFVGSHSEIPFPQVSSDHIGRSDCADKSFGSLDVAQPRLIKRLYQSGFNGSRDKCHAFSLCPSTLTAAIELSNYASRLSLYMVSMEKESCSKKSSHWQPFLQHFFHL